MNPFADRFLLDREIVFLNHGSFGACPRAVLAAQSRLRERIEREPVTFFVRDLEGLLDEARAALGRFVGARADDLAFVANATTGVNAVLRSLRWEAGDELLTTDHAYNACKNALDFVAAGRGARVVVAPLPFPVTSPDEVVAAVMARVTRRTRLALLDHITSPTGLVLPIADLVSALAARGVDTLVDGAHAPGMVPLALDALGAAYYTGNCHKWMCAPKGAAFLHVRADRQAAIRPTVISHGANSPRVDRPRFRVEFDWTGTGDPTPFLCVPEAIGEVGSWLPGGWPEIMERNRALALAARDILAASLGVAAPSPASMIGTLVALPLPDGDGRPLPSPLYLDPLQERLLADYSIEVPIVPWPSPPRRLVRVSAQLYNDERHYALLAAALREVTNAGGA